MRLIVSTLLAIAAVPAMAQTPAPAPSTAMALDPARVVAARELIDVLMPPATREQMITGMITPMLVNLRRGLTENPQFAATMGSDPRVKALFDQFMAKQEQRTADLMRQSLPGMLPAMANAYARRFDVAQLRELRTFFSTPTGRAYMQGAMTIMSDPDVAAWQRQMMTQAMGHVQEDVASFAQQIAALEKKAP